MKITLDLFVFLYNWVDIIALVMMMLCYVPGHCRARGGLLSVHQSAGLHAREGPGNTCTLNWNALCLLKLKYPQIPEIMSPSLQVLELRIKYTKSSRHSLPVANQLWHVSNRYVYSATSEEPPPPI